MLALKEKIGRLILYIQGILLLKSKEVVTWVHGTSFIHGGLHVNVLRMVTRRPDLCFGCGEEHAYVLAIVLLFIIDNVPLYYISLMIAQEASRMELDLCPFFRLRAWVRVF